jgi:hypothetical protein
MYERWNEEDVASTVRSEIRCALTKCVVSDVHERRYSPEQVP